MPLIPAIIVTVRISGLGVPYVLDEGTVQTIANTIVQEEGTNPAFSSNNNPGNLIYAGQTGAVPGAGGFAKFQTYDDGLQALYNQIQLYASRGLTIQDMMNKYAPAGQGSNDPILYASLIANAVGATPDTRLTDLNSLASSTPTEFYPPSLIPGTPNFSPGAVLGIAAAGLFGILLLSRG